MTEPELAIDNIKKMFRTTMALNARQEGESMESLRARIAADAGTLRVAQMLKCSVEDLMEGFGQQEQFHVPEGYNHAVAMAEVNRIMEEVAAMPVSVHEGEAGRDLVGKSGTQFGILAAPKEGDTKAAIVSEDRKSVDALKDSLQRARSQVGALRTNKPGAPKKDPPPGPAKRGR
jgi:hypothetical protein